MLGWKRANLARGFLRAFAPLLVVWFSVVALAQTTLTIHAIQTDLPTSPYLAQTVTTTGIVIAVLTDGFYIEMPQGEWDSDTCTAEGIYVYTPAGLPSNAVSGNAVSVTGVVQASNSSSYAGTEIYVVSPDSSTITTTSTGNSLPGAVSSSTLTSATNGTCSLYSAGTFGQWLPFEGMRVNVPSSASLLVTQGTGGTLTPSSQTATTDGQFWASFATDRSFRSSGISELETVPATAPSTVARWSGNPQLLLVNTTALGGSAINAAAGTLYSGSADLIGIIDYHLSTQGYTGLLLTSASVSALTASNTISATAATTPASGVITLATHDFDDLTAAETTRITKLAQAIVTYEHSPNVLAVQGISSAALTSLISAITAAGGPSYSTGAAVSTADSSGYVNAFLINPSAVDSATLSVSQALASNTWTTAAGATAALFGRSPLVLTAGIPRTGTTDYNIVAVNSSLLPRDNIDSSTEGADTRTQRAQQSQALAALFETYESSGSGGSHLIALGGFESFEFSDGYVDSLGILDGSEAGNTNNGSLVTLYDSTYNTTSLVNTTVAGIDAATGATNATNNRYTFVESGSAEQPDHILITSELADLVTIDYARVGADFPVSQAYDASTVNRASSHDGIVAYLSVPYPSSLTLVSSLNPSYYGESVTFTATATSASGTPTGTVTFYDGSTELGTGTLSSGSTTYATSTLSVGSHTIKAVYGGDATHDTSSASLVQVVETPLASWTTLTCSPNPASYGTTVTCVAAVTGSGSTPTGMVTFYDGTSALGTGDLFSGSASYATNTLSVGSHTITAQYDGEGAYAASTSSAVDEIITATFDLSISPTSRSVYTGESAAYTVTVTPGTGFALDVALSCSGLPDSSTCTFTPATVSGGTGTAQLSIQTTAPAKAAAGSFVLRSGSLAAILTGLLCALVGANPRSRGRMFFACFLALAGAALLGGCGAKGTLSGGTPAGTYTITVTGRAVDGSLTITKTATTTLQVKSLF